LEQKINTLFGKNAPILIKEIRDLVAAWNQSISAEIQKLEKQETPAAGLGGQGTRADFEFPEGGKHAVGTK